MSAGRRCALLVAALGSAACIAPMSPSYSENVTPTVLATASSAGVRDLRGAYREAVCRRLPAAGPPCDQVLLELGAETPAPAAEPRPGAAQRYRIGFVPGLYSECFDAIARPFAGPMADLTRAGFAVHHLPVSGRGSNADNAERLARGLALLPPDPRPFILFAYSKGLPDVLTMLASRPDVAPSIAAVVSVAGAMNGSPLADRLNAVFRVWFSTLPLPSCGMGDGDEIFDLRREARLRWWNEHREQIKTPVFALVTTPREDRVSPILREMYDELAKIDPRNDGQLIWYDQIAPGGSLLGYVNADHWGVALAVSPALPGLGLLFRADVPRTALVEAAIEVVDAALAAESR